MAEQRKRIGEMLLMDGLITETQVQKVLNIQKEDKSRKFGEILVKEGMVDKKTLMQYLLEQID